MASLHDEGLSVSYTYDDSGIRTSKTVNDYAHATPDNAITEMERLIA